MTKRSHTRRATLALAALLAGAAACTPEVDQQPSPSAVVTAVFDPAVSDIPLPNDLALSAQGLAGLPAGAQKDLLTAFAASGGFPNDQEVAITVAFVQSNIAADGAVTSSAPALDLASFGAGTLVVVGDTAAGQGTVALDPIRASDYVTSATRGVLTLHRKGRQPWAPGRYVVGIRGGARGVTAQSKPVYASQVFFLVEQGQDMTTEQNLSILRAQTGSQSTALALGQQLNELIQSYRPAFAVVDQLFPHQELAVLATFTVAPAVTQVELDPARGLVPLPIDLLRDPRPASASCAACGRITPLAACSLAGGTFDAAAGTCSTPAAAGFEALDGFSTTGPLLAATSDLLQAATVTAATVKLYDLTNPALPVLVDPTTYITEPGEVAEQGLSPAVVLQPAGASASDATSPFRTRPLAENTEYAVLITDGVKDKTGAALARGTVARILLLDHPVVTAAGASALAGVDDPTAGALEIMRQKLVPVLAAAAAETTPVTKDHVAMAYTFKTQSFLSQAVQLGALPYGQAAATALPGAVTSLTPAAALSKYGLPATTPTSNLQAILETTVFTFNLLDPATGAFLANPALAAPETLKALVAVPAVTGTPPLVAPLVVYRHGLGDGRADMLAIADAFAAHGMVTVAIDAAKMGDRSFCTSGAATITVPGAGTFPQCAVGTCQAVPGMETQGDAAPPGRCTLPGGTNGDGLPLYRPVATSCAAGGCGWTGTAGIPIFSSNYLVSANFFRTRDTLRQDIIDQSQLVRVVAVDPTHPPAAGTNPLFDALGAAGVVVDPTQIFYAGQSLGAIQGTVDVAANPRFSRAVLNVGGGTVVDVFTNSPAFRSSVDQLLAGLGIARGTADYLQFLAVSKTILDPADPVNYAGHLTANTLPDLLAGGAAQSPKTVLTQMALCDQTVPNTFGYVWAANVGSAPLPPAAGFGGPGDYQLYFKMGASPPTQTEVGAAVATCAVPGNTSTNQVTHGFLLDFADAAITGKAQADAAAYLKTGTNPSQSLVVLP